MAKLNVEFQASNPVFEDDAIRGLVEKATRKYERDMAVRFSDRLRAMLADNPGRTVEVRLSGNGFMWWLRGCADHQGDGQGPAGADMTALPYQSYQGPECTDEELMDLHGRFHGMLVEGQFGMVDAILSSADVTTMDDTWMVAHLRYAFIAKDALPSFQGFYRRAAVELSRRGFNPAIELRGLEDRRP